MEDGMHSEDRLREIGHRRDELARLFKERLERGGDHNARVAQLGFDHLERMLDVMHGYEGPCSNMRLREACIDLAENDLRLAEELLNEAGDGQ